MLVIVELIVLLAAGIIAIVGVLSNAGAAHPLTDFRVRLSPHGVDRHVVPLWDRGRRGGSLGLGLLLTGARPTASRAADARRAAARLHREMAFINRDRDTRLEHQERADSATDDRRAGRRHNTPTQKSTTRSLVTRSTADHHGQSNVNH